MKVKNEYKIVWIIWYEMIHKHARTIILCLGIIDILILWMVNLMFLEENDFGLLFRGDVIYVVS